jgi:hypothetical protein
MSSAAGIKVWAVDKPRRLRSLHSSFALDEVAFLDGDGDLSLAQ